MESLYKDVGITKLAAKKISDEPDNWPQEIKAYLLEESPFVGRYDMVVEFKRLDEATGHGFGFVDISAGVGSTAKRARIPFVVEDRKLKPMDLLITNKSARPLTETRLSEALFRPQVFDSVVKSDEIKPPALSDSGAATSAPIRSNTIGGINTRIKSGSLLSSIKGTILDEDLQKTAALIAADDNLRMKVLDNPGTLAALKTLHESETLEKTSSLSTKVQPTVMQITLTKEGKYRVRSANPKAFAPIVEEYERGMALAKLGAITVRAVDNVGTLTVSSDSIVDKDIAYKKYASVRSPGVYKAVGLDGNPVKGIVFTKVADLDGNDVDMKIFANVDHVSFQDEFVGEKLASLRYDNMPESAASGMGVFYWPTEQGVKSTVPLIVSGVSKIAGETSYDVVSLLEESARVSHAAVRDITKVGSEVLVPTDARFLALPGDSVMPLAADEDVTYRRGQSKEAKARIRAFNDRFTFDGGCGLDKLASDHTTNLEWDDAVFLSTCLGMNPEFAETKLAHALKYAGGSTVRGLTELRTLDEFVDQTRAKLATSKDPMLQFMDTVRQDLWKEAADIDDPDTVDKVLSLNYINPENVRTFIEYLPTLEEAQRKLCELLLGSRIGLKAIDEASTVTAIRGMEKAIQGLKVLLHTSPA